MRGLFTEARRRKLKQMAGTLPADPKAPFLNRPSPDDEGRRSESRREQGPAWPRYKKPVGPKREGPTFPKMQLLPSPRPQ